MSKQILLILICTLFLPAILSADETILLDTPLGRNVRPGCWTPLLVRASRLYGSFSPEVSLRNERTGMVYYRYRLERVACQGELRITLPVLPGTDASTASVTLHPSEAPGAKAPAHTLPGATLRPASPSARLQVWAHDSATSFSGNSDSKNNLHAMPFAHTLLRDLPESSYLYEGIDLLVLGDPTKQTLAQSTLSPQQYAAIGEWIHGGGIAILFDAQLMDGVARYFPDGWQLGPPQPFVLPEPPYPQERRSGLGRLILLSSAVSKAASTTEINIGTLGVRLERALQEQRLFHSRPDNPLLAPEKYGAISDWPPVPSLPASILAALCGGWAIFAVCLVLTLRQRYAIPLIFLAGAAVLFLPYLQPHPNQSSLYSFLLPERTGEPVALQYAQFTTPFPGTAPSGAFPSDLPPPRPLFRTGADSSESVFHLAESDHLWRYSLTPKAGQPPQPYLFITRSRLLPGAFRHLIQTTRPEDVYLDRKEYKDYSRLNHLTFSPDGFLQISGVRPAARIAQGTDASLPVLSRFVTAPSRFLSPERSILTYFHAPAYIAIESSALQMPFQVAQETDK